VAEQKRKRKDGRIGGRRANYSPKAHEVGARRFLPLGWAYWTGFFLFGLLAIAMAVEVVASGTQGRYADVFGALLMGSLFTWMTYLFATSRFEDE
jgi:hypothetical protein